MVRSPSNPDGPWGTVCDDTFHVNEATVACKALGYERPISWAKQGHSANKNAYTGFNAILHTFLLFNRNFQEFQVINYDVFYGTLLLFPTDKKI